MNELRKLEVGCTTKFATMDENGAEKVYKLAIISRPGWRDEDKRYGFAYINDDGFGKITKVSGTYSGGRTGSGVSSYDLDKVLEDDEIVETTDLAVIKKMAEDFENKEANDKKADDARKQEAVKELNNLPKVFFKVDVGDIEYKIERPEFSHNPSYSSKLQGSYSTSRDGKWFSTDDYYRKDGVMLKKKIAGDAKWLVGGELLDEATALVVTLREKRDEAKAQTNAIWNKAVHAK